MKTLLIGSQRFQFLLVGLGFLAASLAVGAIVLAPTTGRASVEEDVQPGFLDQTNKVYLLVQLGDDENAGVPSSSLGLGTTVPISGLNDNGHPKNGWPFRFCPNRLADHPEDPPRDSARSRHWDPT